MDLPFIEQVSLEPWGRPDPKQPLAPPAMSQLCYCRMWRDVTSECEHDGYGEDKHNGKKLPFAGRAHSRGVRVLVAFLIDIFRAVLPLVLLIFVHAGLPFAGLRLSPFASVCIAFFLDNSAYYGEIYRAGLDSVGAGQREAARSTGLTAWQAMACVVIPQAVGNVLPDLVSNTVEMVKLTSLASVVALPEMLYSADMSRSITYNSSPIVLAGLVYLVLLWPAVRFVSRMEHRLGG